MTTKGILMSGPMVRGLLDDLKTQTRRVLRRQPNPKCTEAFQGADGIWRFSRPTALDPISYSDDDMVTPYLVGDRLYVREAWRCYKGLDILPPREISQHGKIHYEADGSPHPHLHFGKFRQGMHQPRWASRLWLEITDVRVQRVQDITKQDAIAEGIGQNVLHDAYRDYGPETPAQQLGFQDARRSFHSLWDSLNAKRGHGWDANPWVAAYTFTVHRGNVDG